MNLPKEKFYHLRNPSNLYINMLRDVELLYKQEALASCITLIVCFIDTLAAGSSGAEKTKYLAFIEQHFPILCAELTVAGQGKPGAVIFYDQFRNGLAHLRAPNTGYALARDDETGGKYIEIFKVDQYGQYIGINVDRLYKDFIELVRKLGNITT